MAFHSQITLHVALLLSAVMLASVGVVALAPSLPSRRTALSQVVAATGATVAAPAWASLSSPKTSAITTVILDSKQDRIGVELANVSIGTNTFPAVKSVSALGVASESGVVPGMVLLGIQGGTSQAVVERIKNGPYPIVLQFYNLAKEDDSTANNMTAEQALAKLQESSRNEADNGPPLSSKGTGLVVKTLNKGDCKEKARRGDTLVVSYEARVASPGGPIFDEGKNARFTMGTKQVVDGLDIGLAGMCPGEIRTLDIPSALGFGPKGSQEFDVPGDVRLWWKVELLELLKK
jgi:FK506-binding protein 2